MDGLLIENLNESKISVCEKVREEMNRLRLRSKYIPSVQSLYSISASLKVIFHNVRSLPLHKYDVFHDFNVSSSDINIFVETNLTSKHRDEDFAMTGFQLHRNDNTEDLCSKAVYGTVVYTKQHITYRTEPLGQTCDNIEITVAILDEPIPNLHLISVYRSPKVSMITLLNVMQLIHNHILQGKPAIIMGDFNVNLLEDSSQRSALLSEMNNIGYTQLIKEVTTDYGSMLDHIYTNTQNFAILLQFFCKKNPTDQALLPSAFDICSKEQYAEKYSNTCHKAIIPQMWEHQAIKNNDDTSVKQGDAHDEDRYFCLSLVGQMTGLEPRWKLMAKLQIQRFSMTSNG